MNDITANEPSHDRFHAHFESVVKDQLAELNRYRVRTMRSILTWWALALPPWLALVYALLQLSLPKDAWKPIVIIGLIVALGLAAWPLVKWFDPYRKSFKHKLVGPLVRAYREGMTYSPEGKVDEREFSSSGLFRGPRLTDYEGEDLIQGHVGEIPFRFSEVKAKEITRWREGGERKSRIEEIFAGLFYVAEFNKHFSGATYVFPDRAQRLLGSIGQSLQADQTNYGQLVKLEDPEFERHFVVYSTSQLEARYILSSALMQRISGLRERMGKKLRIGFIHSKLFVAIATGKNHFEPRLFRSVHREAFREYWDVLDIFVAIVEELNLNTRIWTKE